MYQLMGQKDTPVVDSDGLDLGQAEPAGLASARDAVVHQVVGYVYSQQRPCSLP
jgi:hypothetical protein